MARAQLGVTEKVIQVQGSSVSSVLTVLTFLYFIFIRYTFPASAR